MQRQPIIKKAETHHQRPKHHSSTPFHLKYLYFVVVESWLVCLSCVRIGELPKEDQLVVYNLRITHRIKF